MAGSSPSPEALGVAESLARRGVADLKAARKLSPDPEMDDGMVGFHAQQAVEKALKVSLSLGEVDFPKTHDIDFLLSLAGQSSIEVPEEVAVAGWLTPWAAELRYEDEPLPALDRDAALKVAGKAIDWCEGLLAEAQAPADDEDRDGTEQSEAPD